MKSFRETNGRVHIDNNGIVADMSLKLFIEQEPGYTPAYPAGRLYEAGVIHCIVSNGNQSGDIIPAQTLDAYISKASVYPIDNSPIEDTRTPEEIRRAEILARLDAIDSYSVRPMRAVLAAIDNTYQNDKVILNALETEAEQLRKELAEGNNVAATRYSLSSTGVYHLPECSYAGETLLTLEQVIEQRPDARPCSKCLQHGV